MLHKLRAPLVPRALGGPAKAWRPPLTRAPRPAGCYLGLSPVLQDMIEAHPAMADAHPAAAFFLAGIAAGLTSAVLTQPMDTVKTRLQAFLDVEVRRRRRSPGSVSLI
jgi:hypothetical protein